MSVFLGKESRALCSVMLDKYYQLNHMPSPQDSALIILSKGHQLLGRKTLKRKLQREKLKVGENISETEIAANSGELRLVQFFLM